MPILNRLLAAIPANEYTRLLPKMQEVYLPLGREVYGLRAAIEHLYFPNSGVVSLLAADGGSTVDVGMVGREGVIGISALLGVNESAGRAVVLVEGKAMKIAVADLADSMANGGGLQRVLLRFLRSLFVQVSKSAVCYRFHPTGPRLARWLLMVSDRTGSIELKISQTSLAELIGVRREAINRAAVSLRENELISYERGGVRIIDRPGLESVACVCYRYICDEEESFPTAEV